MAQVLVVDDNPDILNLVQTRLRRRGHKVLAVGSDPAALEAVAERGAPDVAVLEVSIPEMTGLELLQELRRRDGLEHLPAVFLSAKVLPDDIEAGRRLDAIYLTKPFVASALFNAIDNLLEEPDGW